MKRNYLLGILFIAVSFEFAACSTNSSSKKGTDEDTLPSIHVLLMDSTTQLDISKLSNKKPLVLFYFSPDCPFCRAQTEAIIANMKILEDIQFCIITPSAIPEIKSYYKKYHLQQYQNIIVGQDVKAFAMQHFGIRSVPYIIIYNKNGKLKQIVKGHISPSDIRDILFG